MMRSTTWSIVDKYIDSNKLYEDLIVIFANDMFSSMKISAAWQVIAPSELSLRVIAPNASPLPWPLCCTLNSTLSLRIIAA